MYSSLFEKKSPIGPEFLVFDRILENRVVDQILKSADQILKMQFGSQVGKSACIVLAKERHSKGERVPFSACFQLVSKLKSEAASTLSLMFQIFLEKNYRTPWW